MSVAGRLALVALVAVGATACGRKGPPVAPERRIPAAAAGLQAIVEDRSIVVTWNNPTSRLDGTPLRDITTLTLYRREDADGGPLKPAMLSEGQMVGYERIVSFRLDAPAPAVVRGGAVEWVDRQKLTFGRRYVYVVTAADSRGRASAPSERLAVVFLPAPRAPRNLAAESGDRQVRLRWDPPDEFIDGRPIAGEIRYVVLRSAGADAGLAPITPAPVTGPGFTDTGLENETSYSYAVRAVRVDAAGSAHGEAAPPVRIVPADTTPPGPPTNLVAIPSDAAVRLAWNPSPDEDVAIYAVYRAAAAAFIRIGTTLGANRVFVDREVRPRTTYRYAVTALDRAKNANESTRSNEVTVTLP